MTPAQQLLCSCSRLKADDSVLDGLIAGILDWEPVLEGAESQKISPLVYHHLKSRPVPQKVLETLKRYSDSVQARNLIYYASLLRIVKAFNEAGIKVVLLKGIALAEFVYNNIGLRSMQDIDLWIAPRDQRTAARIMTKRKFKVYQGLGEIIAVKPGIYIEIHDQIEAWLMFSFKEKLIWDNTRRVEFQEAFCYIPQSEDLLISLMLHRGYHHAMVGFTLRDVADINAICENFPPDWDKFVARVRELRVSSLAYLYLSFLKRNFTIALPDTVQPALEQSLEPHFVEVLRAHWPHDFDFNQTYDGPAPARILQWHCAGNLYFKLKFLRQALFPPLGHVALKYGLQPGSGTTVLKYWDRVRDLYPKFVRQAFKPKLK